MAATQNLASVSGLQKTDGLSTTCPEVSEAGTHPPQASDSRNAGENLQLFFPDSNKNIPSGSDSKDKNYARNQRKKQKLSSRKNIPSNGSTGTLQHEWRYQIRLLKGVFSKTLQDDLIRDLHGLLYQTPADSLFPASMAMG